LETSRLARLSHSRFAANRISSTAENHFGALGRIAKRRQPGAGRSELGARHRLFYQGAADEREAAPASLSKS
jgi:hypothetical protein